MTSTIISFESRKTVFICWIIEKLRLIIFYFHSFQKTNWFSIKEFAIKKVKSHFDHTTHYFCLEIFVCIHSPLPFYYNFFGKYISKVCKVYSEEFSIGNGRFYTFVSAHKAICYGCSAQSLIIFKEVPYPHSGTLQHQANLKGFFYQLTK